MLSDLDIAFTEVTRCAVVMTDVECWLLYAFMAICAYDMQVFQRFISKRAV